MKLNFLGNGSGFSKTHTGAYFINGKDLIIIDCSMLNLQKILSLGIENFENVYLLITHMHDDHVSGVTLFIQYMYYVYKNKLNILLPKELIENVLLDFKIKGIPNEIYNLYNLDKDISYSWFVSKIPTKHAPELDGECFGYVFNIDGKLIVYSGDTNTLAPYESFLELATEFYVDISANYGSVHLKYEDVEEKLLSYINKYNLDIYVMHIDNEEALKKIINEKIKIVEVK